MHTRTTFLAAIWLILLLGFAQRVTAQTTSPKTQTATIEGTILEATNGRPIAGASVIARSPNESVEAQQQVGADGAFRLVVRRNQTYSLTFSAKGFTNYTQSLAFTSTSTERLFGMRVRLTREEAALAQTPTSLPTATVTAPASSPPANTSTAGRLTPPKTLDAKVINPPPLVVAPKGQTTQLKALQFAQSTADLLPESQPALEQLLQYMNAHPTAEIELMGHTDNVGDFDANIRLSQQRVDAIKSYLVSNGIAANRIATRGYGPTRPIGSNNYEASRQQNRRVEMKVLKE